MALLIYPPDNPIPQLAHLLDSDMRREIACKVNEAILTEQGGQREARIHNLLRLRAWVEKKAKEKDKEKYPEECSIGLDAEGGDTDVMVS